MHAADAMPQIHPIVSASSFDGTITSSENDRLALIRMDHFGSGLSPRLLFHQDKFSALPIAAVLAKHENHLQREAYFSIDVMMEAWSSGYRRPAIPKASAQRFAIPAR